MHDAEPDLDGRLIFWICMAVAIYVAVLGGTA